MSVSERDIFVSSSGTHQVGSPLRGFDPRGLRGIWRPGQPLRLWPSMAFRGLEGRPFKTGDLPFSRFVWANLGANINPHQSSGVRMTDTSAAKRGDPVDQGRLALATLAACFVKTFSESDSQFADRFEKYLSEAYDQLGDMPVSNVGAMETLKWTREMLRDR
jgi:hypothetical protein